MSGPRLEPIDWSSLAPTEQINPRSEAIDLCDTSDILRLINGEDRLVADAVAQAIPEITTVVDRVVEAFSNGARLFYIGAGTSGRLGVLDASECPPTFSTDPELVQGIIAGGDTALRNAVEGAEDSAEAGAQAILDAGVTAGDVVVGISASGGAAYVVSAIEAAQSLGAFTAGVSCDSTGKLALAADTAIITDVGPEVLTGSTRMKAGTAQKLVLNMITTGAMIAWGKTYRNLMVDVKPTNIKLKDRALRLVSYLAGVSSDEAQALLESSGGQVKPAVVMGAKGVSHQEAIRRLEGAGGKLRAVLEALD